jgi:small-conductance mechanosensitive channel
MVKKIEESTGWLSVTIDDILAMITATGLNRLLGGILTVVIVVVVYKIISRSILFFSRRYELSPHVANLLRLVLRVAVIVFTGGVLMSIYGLPSEIFVAGTTITGAIIGFGSSQTINNLIAGLYVIFSRPFVVKDYVKIGDAEGQVEEISINYTKLYTPSFNILAIPNTQVMNNKILNCTYEGFIRESFSIGLPHSSLFTNDEILKECFEPAIEEFNSKHSDKQIRRPEALFEKSDNAGRSFKIRIFIPKGDARTLYALEPELYGMIMNRWDLERKKRQET